MLHRPKRGALSVYANALPFVPICLAAILWAVGNALTNGEA